MNGTSTGSYGGGSVFLVAQAIDHGASTSPFLNGSDYSLRSEQWENSNRVGYTVVGTTDYTTT
ncbi:hypothetical protein [Lewinella sp. IMCC34183]|uniref:hypothetical protein n=1 Tax=Lewinella sp. IMCC34183 TaxID=2248762 RepID=UPI001300B0F5|nr:hypothetical protein [Lewinella sp. IMCC34183]